MGASIPESFPVRRTCSASLWGPWKFSRNQWRLKCVRIAAHLHLHTQRQLSFGYLKKKPLHLEIEELPLSCHERSGASLWRTEGVWNPMPPFSLSSFSVLLLHPHSLDSRTEQIQCLFQGWEKRPEGAGEVGTWSLTGQFFNPSF